MSNFFTKHKIHWGERRFVLSFIGGVIFFGVALMINSYANHYATLTGKTPVPDIILSNIRVFDVDPAVVYGPLLILILVTSILLSRPNAIPFTIKTIALFIIIRAFFISFTHIGQFEPQLAVSADPFLRFLGGEGTGGLFFSGHTGMPLILGLIFWNDKRLRYLFLSLSVILGSVMLMAHLHYTIDVAGAFFITPTIFNLSKKLFKQDYLFLTQGLNFPVKPA